uniref:NADH-ubiquinone oxidoreductase chain 2 n=1 Tax=Gekko rhacophorus TaxID=3148136 RepID=I1Z9E6_9SAUR|nr:NADH dehydrogenase subunit 2 [Ptychozoon rhacophorus]
MSLSTSTIITMSSHHWLLAWMGLELNTLSILPMIIKSHHPRAAEAATKYFLVQAMAAALILFAGIMNAWQMGHWSITNTSAPTTNVLITLAVALKLGMAPMHMWYPEVMQGVNMNTALILSTWQKIAPLTLLYLMNHLPTNILVAVGLASALFGGWLGLNQTQTRKIMALSSIAHMGWLIIALNFNPNITTLTLLTYIAMTTTMFLLLNMTTTKTLSDLAATWSYAPMLTVMTMVVLMSLGGLPPLTGFAPKWLILGQLANMKLLTIGAAMAAASLPSLFFYIRMTYITTLLAPPNTTNTQHNWRFKLHTTQAPPITAAAATLLLPLTPLMLIF